MTIPTYLEALAIFAAETPSAAIPDDVRARGALALADCVGCIVGGVRAPEVTRMAASLAASGSAGAATTPGIAEGLRPEAAALVGGAAGTWLDLDEGNLHTRTHAAIQIAPALLAAAETSGASGRDTLDAFVVAYEVAGRLWRAANIRLAVHPHGTTGPLAAAVALARLRGDGADAMASIMNIAMGLGIVASRATLADGATVRNIFTGHSGRAGFEALGLHDMGFSGERDAPSSILGGIYGDGFDCDAAIAGLGDEWLLRKCYFKRFASARYVHAALDALEILSARMGEALNVETIQRIDIDTFFMAATMANQQVSTPFGLRFSIPASVASQIVFGPAPLTDDGTDAFADARLHDLAKRIFVQEEPAATAAYPARQPARMTVTLRDGRTETAAVERILGEGDWPLPPDALRAKFVELAEPRLGPVSGAGFDRLANLDDAANIAPVMAMLRPTNDDRNAGDPAS